MASDLSSFLKDELTNTLEQLLSKKVAIDSVSKMDDDGLDDSQCIEVSIKFEFSDISLSWVFLIPTTSAIKFEYFMLGGMGDLKEHIDDEIADAVNEIIANICGSLCTSVNAQGFVDISSMKSEVLSSVIKECSEAKSLSNKYYFDVTLDDEKLPIYISFDDISLPYLAGISGVSPEENTATIIPNVAPSAAVEPQGSSSSMGISSLLSEDSAENLRLLFDIKLKLSVRLGSKNLLLKDILRWDIGEIIELEQMVNEPLEILVNGVKIGEGEAVIVEGKFGLKVKSIGNGATKLSHIGF